VLTPPVSKSLPVSAWARGAAVNQMALVKASRGAACDVRRSVAVDWESRDFMLGLRQVGVAGRLGVCGRGVWLA
jgi:hypothetical protein